MCFLELEGLAFFLSLGYDPVLPLGIVVSLQLELVEMVGVEPTFHTLERH